MRNVPARADLRHLIFFAVVASFAGARSGSVFADDQFSPQQLEFFENRVRPLLVEHCHKCHNANDHKAHLVLASRENLLKGGDTGPAVIPGDVAGSELIKAVHYDADSDQMPPDGKLDADSIATFEEWVRI